MRIYHSKEREKGRERERVCFYIAINQKLITCFDL
jgi:hypothetical protein